VLIPLFLKSGVDSFNAGAYVYVFSHKRNGHTHRRAPTVEIGNQKSVYTHALTHPTTNTTKSPTGGAIGAEKKAAATGRPVPTKTAAAKPTIGKPKAAAKPAAGKVVARGGAKAAAAATPAPKKKSGWF
jgi:hypothetical protein